MRGQLLTEQMHQALSCQFYQGKEEIQKIVGATIYTLLKSIIEKYFLQLIKYVSLQKNTTCLQSGHMTSHDYGKKYKI